MLLDDLIREFTQLEADELEPLLLKAREDRANEASLKGVGFQEDESAFQWRAPESVRGKGRGLIIGKSPEALIRAGILGWESQKCEPFLGLALFGGLLPRSQVFCPNRQNSGGDIDHGAPVPKILGLVALFALP